MTLERQGFLDDPSYIEGLPSDHVLRRNENVFGFALGAAAMMVSQFLSMVVQPVGIGNPGTQTYHFTTGMMDNDFEARCNPGCLYLEYAGAGDRFPFPTFDAEEPVDLVPRIGREGRRGAMFWAWLRRILIRSDARYTYPSNGTGGKSRGPGGRGGKG